MYICVCVCPFPRLFFNCLGTLKANNNKKHRVAWNRRFTKRLPKTNKRKNDKSA